MRALLLLLLLGVVGSAWPARAQWASATQISKDTLRASFNNGSGFKVSNDGTTLYSGPLNEVSQGQVPPTLTLTLNGQEVVNGVVPGLAEALPASAAYPRLSPELEQAGVKVGPNTSINTSVGGTLPLVVEAGATQLQLSLESVDGQSLSVYSPFRPSLSLPRESGLYADPNDPNNPNANNAGPTVFPASGSPL
jgi:hypothetical protein